MKLYKVLVNGKSAHGGDFKWSLPRGSKKGKWHSVTLPLENCVNGFHLTDNPAKWALAECEVFEVEVDGQKLPFDDFNNKICVEKVRLVKKVESSELLDLFKLQIVTEGHYRVSEGLIVASGSASVKAFDSASVKAYGSASVKAFDSASVKAYGSASVEAFDSASVVIPNPYGSDNYTLKDKAVCVNRKIGKLESATNSIDI